MRRTAFVLLCCLSTALFLARFAAATAIFRVNEATTRLSFARDETIVSLALENQLGQSFPAHIRLELLDTQGLPRATVEQDAVVKNGSGAASITLPIKLGALGGAERKRILWYRLRYVVSPGAGAPQAAASEGIISLSEITPEVFELRVAAPQTLREGATARAQVRAVHPVSLRPVAGVKLDGELKFDGDDDKDIQLKAARVTDAEGYAALDFRLPQKVSTSEGELKISGRLGEFEEEASEDLELDRRAQILISTDKPLYQPGQTLHLRALVFDPSRRALADASVHLEIESENNETIFRAPLKTSRFGIASCDWQIPENARLGNYSLHVKIDDGPYEESESIAAVKISRYDLPNFVVTVSPDRPYYLPGQDAEIEIRADYLFGQPIARGHVRLVREKERRWNYSEQKWETDEGEKYEAEAEKGSFTVRVNLAEEHKRLAEEDYSRYHDLSYVAYFTDPTTNRTEERRFDLRLTKEAIHVYVQEEGDQSAKLPLEFYVSTFYADGTPAQCDVEIAEESANQQEKAHAPSEAAAPALRTIKTNAYGLAEVKGLTMAAPHAADGESSLAFLARDGKGATGRFTNSFSFTKGPVIRVLTDKTLYRQGQPVRARVLSSVENLPLTIDVLSGGKVVRSENLKLQGGQASLVIPYTVDLKDEVTVAAYSSFGTDSDNDYYSMPRGSRTVLYPRDRDLKVDVQLAQTTYKPGEEARASFAVRTPSGRPVAGALGVVVLDRAVEERARTDREFGAGGFYGYARSFGDYAEEVAGIKRRDLDHLDLSKPLPEGFELVAAVMLMRDDYWPKMFSSENFERDESQVFSGLIASEVNPVTYVLEELYKQKSVYPSDEEALRRTLLAFDIDLEEVRDPWGLPYRAKFSVERDNHLLELRSAGADKRFDTADDFTAAKISRPYFRAIGEAINHAVASYHARTGQFIRDAAALKSELAREGLDFEALRDPWGHPYQLEFEISKTDYVVNVKSAGPDGKMYEANASADDFTVWSSPINYFTEMQGRINVALLRYQRNFKRFPRDEKEFGEALKRAGLAPESLLDPWGHAYALSFKTEERKIERVSLQTYAKYGEKPQERTETVPVTEHVNYIYLRSLGPDGKPATGDEFDVASFINVAEGEDAAQQLAQAPTVIQLSGASGAIGGAVVDPNGAVIPNATVTATRLATSTTYTATTDDNGRYVIGNIPAGYYQIRVDAVGFKPAVVTQVYVRSSRVARLDTTLDVGAVTETVSVMAENSVTLNTTSATLGAIAGQRATNLQSAVQIATPRLREYFPETLYWQPAIETDARGRAAVEFKLADNITTWKLAVIGSTEDGQLGMAETEIRAFQPFFVEHDPPRILTEGDEIALPVVLRNYLDKSQTVALEMKPESWFALAGPSEQRAEVASGEAARETFTFRAVSSVKDGRQRITARGLDASDAIEKPITVHPDGEEIVKTASQILTGSAALDVNIPSDAISGTPRAELKIYPDLMAHVFESIDGILERPYGCGEQTISSTYPNLMILRAHKETGKSSAVTAKARKYLQQGYERLLGYRADSGGFTYWGRGEADLALTAYAFRFLSDAKELLSVDENILTSARDYLIRQQQSDGAWADDALLTSYIARTLASAGVRPAAPTAAPSTNSANQPRPELALKRALDYLTQRVNASDEPYLVASYALAALDAGGASSAQRAVTKLRAMAREDNGALLWEMKSNTPFHGWGRAASIEATALAVRAFTRAAGADDPSAGRGLIYLLRAKDRYGVWLSTQATINVLDTFITLLAKHFNANAQAAPLPKTIEVIVNGRTAANVPVEFGASSNPVMLNLSQFLLAGGNRVELRAPGSFPQATVQLVSSYYVPWSSEFSSANHTDVSSALRLKVEFDRQELKANEEVTCRVETGRKTGGRNYGMMIAEVGLPPGAEVERESLERAATDSGWSLNHYDVLPDRVVLYLWPGDGSVRFEFKFRPRFGLAAQTAPSVIYDYYNPDARAVIAPKKFIVRRD